MDENSVLVDSVEKLLRKYCASLRYIRFNYHHPNKDSATITFKFVGDKELVAVRSLDTEIEYLDIIEVAIMNRIPHQFVIPRNPGKNVTRYNSQLFYSGKSNGKNSAGIPFNEAFSKELAYIFMDENSRKLNGII